MDESGAESTEDLHFFYEEQSVPTFVEYNGVKYHYIHNSHGDIVGIIDAAGNLVVEYEYDAWGKLLSVTGTLKISLVRYIESSGIAGMYMIQTAAFTICERDTMLRYCCFMVIKKGAITTMKKERIVALIITLIILLSASTSLAIENTPPVGEARSDDSLHYLECNDYVLSILGNSYVGILPSEIDEQGKPEYHYRYSCAVFGDPNFSIFLSMKYDDEEEYNKEIARIDHLMNECTNTELICDSTYILTGAKQDIEKALDDQIYDGLRFNFEIVHCDEQNLKVWFYLAQIWDGSVPEDDKKMLQSLTESMISP